MAFFDFMWTWYEDAQHHWLSHPTANETIFKDDCREAMRAVGGVYLAGETSWAGMPDWVDAAVDWMVANRGYIRIIAYEFSVFGGYILKSDDSETDEIRELVGDDLFVEAAKHNLKIENNRDKR